LHGHAFALIIRDFIVLSVVEVIFLLHFQCDEDIFEKGGYIGTSASIWAL